MSTPRPALSRRQFLQTSAAASAVIAAPYFVPNRVFGANDRVNLAFVGVKNSLVDLVLNFGRFLMHADRTNHEPVVVTPAPSVLQTDWARVLYQGSDAVPAARIVRLHQTEILLHQQPGPADGGQRRIGEIDRPTGGAHLHRVAVAAIEAGEARG